METVLRSRTSTFISKMHSASSLRSTHNNINPFIWSLDIHFLVATPMGANVLRFNGCKKKPQYGFLSLGGLNNGSPTSSSRVVALCHAISSSRTPLSLLILLQPLHPHHSWELWFNMMFFTPFKHSASLAW